MRSNLITASVLAIASYTLALAIAPRSATQPTILILNHCPEDLWLTVKGNSPLAGAPIPLTHKAWEWDGETGVGISYGITQQDQEYYSLNTPKMIFAITNDGTDVYWSVDTDNGDPLGGRGFSITSPTCKNANVYSEHVNGCADDGVFIQIDLCTS